MLGLRTRTVRGRPSRDGGPANPQPAEGLASVAVDSASAGFSFSGGVGMLERGNVATKSYSADIQGLRRDFPEVKWHTFEQWARRQDWRFRDQGQSS